MFRRKVKGVGYFFFLDVGFGRRERLWVLGVV